MFNAMYSLGNLVAPLMGGIINYFVGYEWTCNIIAFMCIAFSMVFYSTMIWGRNEINGK
jgi:hypothetical protein